MHHLFKVDPDGFLLIGPAILKAVFKHKETLKCFRRLPRGYNPETDLDCANNNQHHTQSELEAALQLILQLPKAKGGFQDFARHVHPHTGKIIPHIVTDLEDYAHFEAQLIKYLVNQYYAAGEGHIFVNALSTSTEGEWDTKINEIEAMIANYEMKIQLINEDPDKYMQDNNLTEYEIEDEAETFEMEIGCQNQKLENMKQWKQTEMREQAQRRSKIMMERGITNQYKSYLNERFVRNDRKGGHSPDGYKKWIRFVARDMFTYRKNLHKKIGIN